MLSIGIRALLIIIATPAFIVGLIGSLKYSSLKDFPKHHSIISTPLLFKCVSCIAEMAILFSLIVLFILIHLSVKLSLAVGAFALFMFSATMFMFALLFLM